MNAFRDSMLELIVETSTNLPDDVRRAMKAAALREAAGSRAAQAMEVICQNIDRAFEDKGAICQDTGMPTFDIHCPPAVDPIAMRRDIEWAVAEATRLGKLRPNSVDSLTGRNSGDNLGAGTPVLHFATWDKDEIRVRLLLKGGGCENKSAQYSLPADLEGQGRADRDLDGVRKCILHSLWAAQGQGCSSGFLGVCVGGDRATGYAFAKEQLFRPLDDRNADARLAKLEEQIVEHGNQLGVGPMGFGGAATVLSCKIGVLNRLPASFFVSIAYNCWAFRRLTAWIDITTGRISRWEQRAESPEIMAKQAGFPTTGRETRLTAPLTEEAVRRLHVGDVVLLSGPMHTGRDALHKHLTEHDSPVDLQGGVIYHCGPVMLQEEGQWVVKAAGPTTSSREEPYQAAVIEKFGLRAIVGKGGMGAKTSAALQKHGAVYLNAIGGAAQFYARTLPRVSGVHFLEEFGVPEAMWHFEAIDFPAIVTMDSHGASLHADIQQESLERLKGLAD
ncbi:MAG: L(+)-tartrate dehydratase subunit beta [candidate division BRC1 bacterium ADurb.BinA364]|nr:MAG: L(+)-tartrate dehydratase subunit beta [candidate division BRC1 bacterium ADurb.BinA364]